MVECNWANERVSNDKEEKTTVEESNSHSLFLGILVIVVINADLYLILCSISNMSLWIQSDFQSVGF